MAAPKPTILFIHGAYHPPACYAPLTDRLRNEGFEVVTPRLASLGADKHGVTLDDDVAAIRDAAAPLLAAGKSVLVVAHSIGGFLSTIAVKDYTLPTRKASGLPGGFAGIVYICSTLTARGENVMTVCTTDSAVLFHPEARDDGKVCFLPYP